MMYKLREFDQMKAEIAALEFFGLQAMLSQVNKQTTWNVSNMWTLLQGMHWLTTFSDTILNKKWPQFLHRRL